MGNLINFLKIRKLTWKNDNFKNQIQFIFPGFRNIKYFQNKMKIRADFEDNLFRKRLKYIVLGLPGEGPLFLKKSFEKLWKISCKIYFKVLLQCKKKILKEDFEGNFSPFSSLFLFFL